MKGRGGVTPGPCHHVQPFKEIIMKKFNPVSAPFEGDFYEIYMVEGVKHIHIFGYSYKSSNFEYKTDDNPYGVYWASVECVGFVFKLEEFVSQYKKHGSEFIDYWYCELKQYQKDYMADEMTKAINGYFDGKGADAYLGFGEINNDTECGNYIN